MNHQKLLQSFLQQASQPIVLQSIGVVFILLMGWEIVSSVRLFPMLNQKVQLSESRMQNTGLASSEIAKVDDQAAPLFGDYVPPNLDAAGVSESMLNLKVVGIIFAVDEKDSEVLLQKPDGQEQFFRVSDKLTDGSEIKRITTEGVLVLRNGKLERLSLPKEDVPFENPAQPIRFENEK